MSGYRLDPGVQFLTNDQGQIVGYVDNNGVERSAGFGLSTPRDTPALAHAAEHAAMGVAAWPGQNISGLRNKTLGDSRLANGYASSASQAAVDGNGSYTQVGLGDQYSQWGGPQYVAKFLAGDLISISEFAVSGSRVDPVSGRSDDVISFQLPAALASGDPLSEIGTLYVTANDRGASPINPIAEVLASLRSVVDQWCSTGRRLDIVLEPPQRGAYWGANAPDDWVATVALQRELAAKYPDLINLVDTSGLCVATGVVYPSGDTKDPYYDDVHSKFRGSFIIGKGIHDGRVAKGWLPANTIRQSIVNWRNRLSSNKATNPQMTGTGGTGTNSGTAPTSWSFTRSASNSWDKSAVYDGVPTLHAVSTVFVAGDRVSTPTYPDYDYLAISTTGTTAGSIPALSQTVLGTTTDGTVTWLTIPKCPDLYGVNCAMAYGVGTADITREILLQDVTLASTGWAVGDTIEASVFFAALKGFYGAQIELQAINVGSTKILSTFGMLAAYLDSSAIVADGTVGRMAVEPFVIPAGTTTLRIKAQAYSKNGLTQAFLFGAPELRKLS